ncbi:MAG: hypothetical protein KZQ76_00105 [Candidatus Thiodiazotropha sp. (ex Epidulcina cf. delphinae)]|nr:hypothetical protein [Candidatus Thiodiazotropha sp. (ex Epidulcina cf. delphinae)]
MPEYRLKFTENSEETEQEDESRQRTLDELNAFVETMDARPLAIVTLDKEQSALWDQEGDTDYQDAYGRQIIGQVSDGVTETLVIRNCEGLPVALAARNGDAGWQGIGIDKRLRFEIATALHNDETEFE